ncbi:MAG: type VI secretion system ImpA family N-terminal domain-containing protein, partial [Spirochaetaceae bacterium]|nr:type VI secretion system ImpA family N-terminal domain-containing protein [Spirochaetaceae bacterium]
MINAAELAVKFSDGDAAGQNLEYDPLYVGMDALAQAVPDSFMGDSKIEGRGPDWKNLSKNCLELWKRTRDLRVAVYLSIAEAVTGGLAGLAEGLKVLVFLVKELWGEFYPRLDPDDNNDPLERINILSMLSPPSGSVNDPVMFIPRFREIRLVPSLRYTLRDLLISTNEIEAADSVSIDAKLLRAEFISVPEAEIEDAAALAREVKSLAIELCDEMNAKMGDGNILDMSALCREVDHLVNFYDQHEAPAAGENTEEPEAEGALPGTSAATAAPGTPLALLSYRASSRTEALLLLKKGAEYFQREEPNSPIPQLVDRAVRFSEMSFIDLIEDI